MPRASWRSGLGCDPVVGAGQHLEHGRDIDPARGLVADAAVQLGAEDAGLEQALGDGGVGDVVAGRMLDRGVLGAEGPVAPVEDAALLDLPAALPQRLVGEELEADAGVIHQVPADLIGRVGDLGDEEQLRRLEAVAGDDEVAGREPHVVALRGAVVDGGDLAGLALLKAIGGGVGAELGARLLGMVDMDDAAIHRADRADRHAVVVAGTGRAAVIGRGHPRVRLVDEVVAEVEEPGLEALEEVGLALGRQRIGGRARRERLAALSALVFLAGAGDAEGDFGQTIPGLEVVIVDRPVAPDAVGRLELHVVRDVAPARRRPSARWCRRPASACRGGTRSEPVFSMYSAS